MDELAVVDEDQRLARRQVPVGIAVSSQSISSAQPMMVAASRRPSEIERYSPAMAFLALASADEN
jgi:hypothetical protein